MAAENGQSRKLSLGVAADRRVKYSWEPSSRGINISRRLHEDRSQHVPLDVMQANLYQLHVHSFERCGWSDINTRRNFWRWLQV